MYKKMLPLLLLAVSSSALSFGQSTLTAANFNMVSTDAFSLKICNTAGVTPGSSGPSQLWNFTSLVPTATDTGKVIGCPSTDATTHCSLFPTSNIAFKGPGLNYQTIYYTTNATTVSQNGYYSATDTNMMFTDPVQQFTYPFTYGTNFTDNYAGVIVLGALSGHVNGTISVICDGYGTLNLPGRTDTGVLRVHTTQTFIDSVHVLTGGTAVLTYTLETYSWYKAGYHSALLTIATATQTGAPTPFNTFVAYAPSQLVEVPEVPGNLESLTLYPNPVQNELNIDLATKSTEAVRITLMDMTGRTVAVLADKSVNGAQHISYNTTSLAKGLYMVRIQSGESTTTRKIEIQ